METGYFERLQRPLGRLGVAVTGLLRRPDVSPTAIKRAIGLAIDLGVNVFDTAPSWGESERLCGETLRSLHALESAVLITKVPPASELSAGAELLMDDEGEVFRDPLPKVFAPDYLEYRLERSLRATKLEVLPLVLLEAWRDSWLDSTAWPELVGAMTLMQRKGKVLRWGLSVPVAALPHTMRVLDQPIIAAVAAPYGLWSMAAERLATAAAERKVAFFAAQVMGQGGLSGEILATSVFRHDDIRHLRFEDPVGRTELSRRVAEFAAFTKSVPPAAESCDAARAALEQARAARQARECETMAELAVRFPISTPQVATAVIGTSSAEHVRANAAAVAQGALSERVLEPLRELIARYAR